MKKEYNFDQMQARPNPYFAKLSREVTLRVGLDALAYFDSLADETGIDAAMLMAAYLRDCAIHRYRPEYGLPQRKGKGTKDEG